MEKQGVKQLSIAESGFAMAGNSFWSPGQESSPVVGVYPTHSSPDSTV
jgi:hypothetical protein